ncbi:hypothetical protein ACQKDD_08925 [Planococcus kocurii]|uniref:DUF3993 domain-containing protein n=1 Tax=Planococcus kocurii TaxID=1374 RepID=A0ABM5WUT2_9BACL|nr:hypothetical protein [Planococcus kocurii]ALS77999.1 hypothetical protein AUO94_04760 [Planococcus kocurii]
MNIFTRNRWLLGFLLVVVSCLLIVGCSSNEKAKTAEAEKPTESLEKDKAAIQAVIEKQFNGPDNRYRQLWDAATEIQTANMNEEQYDAWLKTPEYNALIDYMNSTYASYFTENAYETFRNTDAFLYSYSDREYKLTTSAIEITQSEKERTLYPFTFQVMYENESGETEIVDFEGQAIVPVAGKIGKIQFNNQEKLLQKIEE